LRPAPELDTLEGMELMQDYRGFQICRASTGAFVVLAPGETEEDRLCLVCSLARDGLLDELFLGSVQDARAAVDGFIAELPPVR
jgi:hypothetical protein